METRNPTILSRIEIKITRRRETKVELSQLTVFDGNAGLISNREKRGFAEENMEIISQEEQRGLRRSIPVYRVSSSSPPWYPW